MKPCLIYNADIRNNGTPVYLWSAFTELLGNIDRYRPDGEIPKHDFYIQVDDGRDDIAWNPPHPCGYYAVDTHLGYDFRRRKAENFDIVWTAQKPAAERMRSEGLNAHWLPLACNPVAHPTARELQERLKIPIAEHSFDIVFVGFMQDPAQSTRIEFLDALFRAYPNFFFAYGVFHEDMARLYHRGRIGINHAIRDDLNMRFFELASIGVPQLCDRRMVGLAELGFLEDVHYIGYDSTEEAIAKIKLWLEQPKDLRIMAGIAYSHVTRSHTYIDRAKVMLRDARDIVRAGQRERYAKVQA